MTTAGKQQTMKTRRIGSLDVSTVGLGCNNFGRKLDEQATAAVVQAALDTGITFFDTADIYGDTKSELFLGRALRGHRNEVVIATKFGMAVDDKRKGARPEYVRQAAEDSLRRLGIDCIDLYQLHQPDPAVPIDETLGAMDDLVQAGKVREIGCSNFSVDQIREAEAAVKKEAARFVSVQNEYSLLHREPEQGVLAGVRAAGAGISPLFPLASGLLTGKYRRGRPAPEGSRLSGGRYANDLNDRNLAVVESLVEFAGRRGHTVLELAISWLLMRPAVASVIAGATTPDQVRANAVAADWKLSSADLTEIDSLLSRSEK